jgi:Putative auto-transporter adhesin, head GIN domain
MYMRNALTLSRQKFWLILALPLCLGACQGLGGKRVHGDGNIQTEDHAITTFRTLDLRVPADIYLNTGDHASVKIEGDNNLLKFVDVEQSGDVLTIRTHEGFNLIPSGDLKIYVTTPTFEKIDATCACNIESQNKLISPDGLEMHLSGAGNIKLEVDAPHIDARLSGAGNISLKGQTKDVKLNLSGAGNAHCYELLAENTDVNISGFGSAEVYASVKLSASVSGAGNVDYKGNATEIEKHISGAGDVHKAD